MQFTKTHGNPKSCLILYQQILPKLYNDGCSAIKITDSTKRGALAKAAFFQVCKQAIRAEIDVITWPPRISFVYLAPDIFP